VNQNSGSSPLCARPAAPRCAMRAVPCGAARLAALTRLYHHPIGPPGSAAATSGNVTMLPHHSTASRTDELSSWSSREAPRRRLARQPGLLLRVHQVQSTPLPPTPRAGVPDRHVLCAEPTRCLMLSVAPLASPTADSSHLPCPLSTPVPYRHQPFHSALSSCEDASGHHRRSRSVLRTPSRFQDPVFDTDP
jgi:hypothetical protein